MMADVTKSVEALASALAQQDGYELVDYPAWYRGEAAEVIKRLERDGIKVEPINPNGA